MFNAKKKIVPHMGVFKRTPRLFYSSEASFSLLHPKKNVCACVQVILVLVLGRQTVYGQKTVYLCLSTYIVFENTHAHSNVRVTTAASETEGVAAVSWIESLMIRRPLGSIDPVSYTHLTLPTIYSV